MMSSPWFDNLATRAIDPAFKAVRDEARERDPEFIVTADLAAPPPRERCSLAISNRDARNAIMSGSLAIVPGQGDQIRVEHSFQWDEGGRPRIVATLDSMHATETEIRRLARTFVEEFFHRVARISR